MLESGISAIQKYVNDGHLTLSNLGQLDENTKANLNSEIVRSLFDKHLLNYQEVSALTANQRYVLEKKPAIRAQFEQKELSLKFINFPTVQKYISDKVFTEAEFDLLTAEQKLYANSEVLREVCAAGHATFPQIRDLRTSQWTAIKDAGIAELVKAGRLLLGLCDYPVAQKYVDDRRLDPEQFSQLSDNQKANLGSKEVGALYDTRLLSYDAVLNLTMNQRFVLETNAEVREQFQQGKLLFVLIEYPHVQKFVDDGFLTKEGVDKLKAEQKLYLNTPVVCDLVKGKFITFDQAINLTAAQFQGIKGNPDIVTQFKERNVVLLDGGLVKANNAAPNAAMFPPAPAVEGDVAARADVASAKSQRQAAKK
jgi:hypothetical protein